MTDDQIRADAAWLARLARSSSWPGEMAQRVEDAADRVEKWAAPSPDVAGEVAALREELENQRLMHKAYRPEVVAEIAVQLTEDADWQEIATWCGGTLRHSSDPSGEATTYLDLPGVGSVCQGMWVTLGHDGQFRARAEIAAPTAAPSPGEPGERSPIERIIVHAARTVSSAIQREYRQSVDGMEFDKLVDALDAFAPGSVDLSLWSVDAGWSDLLTAATAAPDVERAERADTALLRAALAWLRTEGHCDEADAVENALAAPASPVPEVQPDPGAWSDELKMAQVATRYWQDVINGKRDADPTADDQRKLHLARLGEAVLLATEAMDR